jgi:hypothetical protein
MFRTTSAVYPDHTGEYSFPVVEVSTKNCSMLNSIYSNVFNTLYKYFFSLEMEPLQYFDLEENIKSQNKGL